ncbi:pyridoxal phosphate-dependent aminotransferase [Clostridiaceae bacterium 35-E11]
MKYDFDKVINREKTNSIKWERIFIENRFGYNDLLPMWIADMDFKCPQPVVDALIKRVEHGIYGYSQVDDEYYQAVVNWNRKRHGLEINKDWIVFVPGVVPALNYLIKTFCLPGDKVIIQNPVYYPFSNAVLNNGCQPGYNALKCKNGRYTMDFDDLEEKAKDPRVKLMILCNPHNPVGRVWKKEELEKMGEICIRNNVIIIADEIHSDLILKGYKHTPLMSISEKFAQSSIICTAPSKTFNLAGMQTANIIIKNENMRACFYKTLESNSVGWTNPFGIVALIAAYNDGEEWLDQVLKYLENNVDFMETFIQQKIPEVKFVRPEGTYLSWLDFRTVTKDEKKLEVIMREKAKVALDEGHIFGEGGEGFARLNFACPRSVLEESLHRIEKAIHSL